MSTAEYKREKYTQLAFYVPKSKGTEYKQVARDLGMQQSDMLRQAIEEFVQNHAGGDFLPVKPAPIKITPEPQITKEQRAMLEEISKLPVDTQKALLKFLRSLNGNAATTAQETE